MFRWTHSNSGVVSAMSRASTARIRTSCVPYVKHRDLKHVRVVTALDPHVADQVPEKRRFLRPNNIRQKDWQRCETKQCRSYSEQAEWQGCDMSAHYSVRTQYIKYHASRHHVQRRRIHHGTLPLARRISRRIPHQNAPPSNGLHSTIIPR